MKVGEPPEPRLPWKLLPGPKVWEGPEVGVAVVGAEFSVVEGFEEELFAGGFVLAVGGVGDLRGCPRWWGRRFGCCRRCRRWSRRGSGRFCLRTHGGRIRQLFGFEADHVDHGIPGGVGELFSKLAKSLRSPARRVTSGWEAVVGLAAVEDGDFGLAPPHLRSGYGGL